MLSLAQYEYTNDYLSEINFVFTANTTDISTPDRLYSWKYFFFAVNTL